MWILSSHRTLSRTATADNWLVTEALFCVIYVFYCSIYQGGANRFNITRNTHRYHTDEVFCFLVK